MTLVDPLGRLITEIRSDPAVAVLTTRIRGGEPAAGDALGPGSYLRFVVLTRMGGARAKRNPVQWLRIGVRCYGTTFADAAQLFGAVSDAVHFRGPRISTGIVIHRSYDDTGGDAEKDPDTGQPFESGVISLIAADRLAAV